MSTTADASECCITSVVCTLHCKHTLKDPAHSVLVMRNFRSMMYCNRLAPRQRTAT